VRAHDRLPDKVSEGLIREVAFEFIPESDQTAGALELQVHERTQRTEGVGLYLNRGLASQAVHDSNAVTVALES